MRSLVLNRSFVGRPHSWYTKSCPQCGVSWGQLSQTLTIGPFSATVCPGGKTAALTFTRPPATWSVGKHRLLLQAQLSAMRTVAPIYSSWVQTNDGCRRGCPQCGVWPGCGIGGCAPIMGASGVVRNAESGPAPGFRGCVVGRVVEVEFVGVCGRTRRPVLDFRPAVGIVVAAVPATSVAPR